MKQLTRYRHAKNRFISQYKSNTHVLTRTLLYLDEYNFSLIEKTQQYSPTDECTIV